ncbi:MAG: SurA N-terminal domain-containing protein [Desulfovibrio sp.]|nr:SurA N-terminal domain-containing protein [Desulfovibrio sp.]
MLDSIRSNAQSFGVKIAFGIIILVFVFWGVGSFTEGDSSRVMANVNGEPILEPQFYKHYQMIEEQLARRGMSREQMKAEHLGRQVLQNMIAHALVRQEAERLGMQITPLELRNAIEQNELFQNDSGKLDKESYARGLASLRLSATDFEQQMRDELLFNKMLELVSSSVWIDPEAARSRFDFLFEKRVLDYLFIPSSDFLSGVSVTDEEKKTYYEGHKTEFTLPKKAEISFVRLAPAKLVDPKSISEADAKAWYDKNRDRYVEHEAVRVAHILVPLDPKASEEEKKAADEKVQTIYAELKGGKKFADLANKYNDSRAAGKDGELGWIERGVTVEPFEKAAFSQEVGVVSEKPVLSQFGLHVILVHEKREEKVRTFDEVKKEILASMALELGQDKVAEVGETLLENTLLGKDLGESAASTGLSVEKSGYLSADDFVSKMGFSSQDAALLLSGMPIDTLLQAGEDAVVVKVDGLQKESILSFEDVREKIEKALLAKKAQEAALKKAEKVRKELVNGPVSQEQRAKLGLKTSGEVERSGEISPFVVDDDLITACFAAAKDEWLGIPYVVRMKEGGATGAALFHVQSVKNADEADWERIGGILKNGYAADTADNIRSFFVNELRKKAKITNVQYEKADRFDS